MPSPDVIVLQHAASEGLGNIADALSACGRTFQYIRSYAGESVPRDAGAYRGLVIMGGPMGVYEHSQYPFLRDEMKLMESFLKAGKPILGVCLGSQLLASVLGAEVKKGARKEIGWYPIRLHAEAAQDSLWKGQPASFNAYHWHGDIFDLPKDAVPLASSDLTALQAFRYGNQSYGLLFHMEVSHEQVRGMLREFESEIQQEKLDGRLILDQTTMFLPAMQQVGRTVFKRWAELMNE